MNIAVAVFGVASSVLVVAATAVSLWLETAGGVPRVSLGEKR